MGRVLATYTGKGVDDDLRRALLGPDETDAILESWAASWVHRLGLCSPNCHGPGSRRHPQLRDVVEEPIPEDAARLPLDDRETWATRALRNAGVVLFIRDTGPRTIQVIALDTGSWTWTTRFREKP